MTNISKTTTMTLNITGIITMLSVIFAMIGIAYAAGSQVVVIKSDVVTNSKMATENKKEIEIIKTDRQREKESLNRRLVIIEKEIGKLGTILEERLPKKK